MDKKGGYPSSRIMTFGTPSFDFYEQYVKESALDFYFFVVFIGEGGKIHVRKGQGK